MSEKVKTTLKIFVGLIVIVLLMHLTRTYLVPFIMTMHSSGEY